MFALLAPSGIKLRQCRAVSGRQQCREQDGEGASKESQKKKTGKTNSEK